MGQEIEYSWMQGKGPGFEAAKAVREKVFVEEQGYSADRELDEIDAWAHHLVGRLAGEPVCAARVFLAADGLWQMGRVAVLPGMRGRGFGLAVVRAATQHAKAQGARGVVLNAQADKTHLYHRAGYRETGATSLDEGHPHTEMLLLFAE